MKNNFSKYQGTGNDFILLYNIDGKYNDIGEDEVKFLCDRKFGIGSDGLIILNKSAAHDFYMDFSNPDGSSSFCGNGCNNGVRLGNASRQMPTRGDRFRTPSCV